MKSKKILISMVTILVLLGVSSFAEANHTRIGYSTTVGKFNGNGYSDEQVKSVKAQKADVTLYSNGGYNVDVRTTSRGSNGTWSRALKAADSRTLTNVHNKGTRTKLHFSNNLNTRVDTQATGNWRSN